MTDTTFVDNTTVIVAAWLNDVNDATYTTIPSHTATLATQTSDIATNASIISNHIVDTSAAHIASSISNTPAGSIAATDVQAAINELDTETVKLAGNQTIAGVKTFSSPVGVAAATASGDAPQLNMVSLMPTVASAAAPDIFGAAGATINYTGTTTCTSLTACTSAQIGSVKRIICAGAAPFTASASMTIDGASSGTTTYPAGAELEVRAITTTTFAIRTVLATASWTPNQGAGLTVVGAFSSTGLYTRIGRTVTITGRLVGSTSVACSAGGVMSSNLPFTNGAVDVAGGCANYTGAGGSCLLVSASSSVLAYPSQTAASAIVFSLTYFV